MHGLKTITNTVIVSNSISLSSGVFLNNLKTFSELWEINAIS